MQELEKILEEIKESSIIVATSKEHYIHPQDGRFVEEVVLLDCVEDIIRKHMNDGWIPVEEQLPEDDRMVLVTCQTKKGIRSVNRAYCDGAFWHGSGSMSGVIAWRPMPEVYRQEGSEGK